MNAKLQLLAQQGHLSQKKRELERYAFDSHLIFASDRQCESFWWWFPLTTRSLREMRSLHVEQLSTLDDRSMYAHTYLCDVLLRELGGKGKRIAANITVISSGTS